MVSSLLLPGYLLVTAWLLPGYCLVTTGYYVITSWLLSGYFLVTMWLLPGYCLVIALLLPVTIWVLPGYCLVTELLLPGYFLVTAWLLSGYCLVIFWSSVSPKDEIWFFCPCAIAFQLTSTTSLNVVQHCFTSCCSVSCSVNPYLYGSRMFITVYTTVRTYTEKSVGK